MQTVNKRTVVCIIMLSFTPLAQAQIYLTPWIGFTGGGEVETTLNPDENYNIDPGANYAISVESDFQTGRLGLYYSYQDSEVDEINLDTSIQYLLLQSSIYYDFPVQVSAYVGAGVGGSYLKADWVDNNAGFAASVFGGFEYPITNNISFNTQVRWLGTIVDGSSRAACNLPAGANNCVVQFKSDWMNQFTTNFGLVMKF